MPSGLEPDSLLDALVGLTARHPARVGIHDCWIRDACRKLTAVDFTDAPLGWPERKQLLRQMPRTGEVAPDQRTTITPVTPHDETYPVPNPVGHRIRTRNRRTRDFRGGSRAVPRQVGR